VLTPAEMAEADRQAIAAGTPVEVLMERAGRAVARAVRRECGGIYGARVVIVCGKGNNGGDGLVAARVLRGWGARVHLFELERGVDPTAVTAALGRADVFVDAMYGTGFRGELEGDAAGVVDAADAFEGVVRLAVDIPSGVDGRTGAASGPVLPADLTVCFAALKSGLCFEPGRALAGAVEVVDIGIAVPPPTWASRGAATEPGATPQLDRVGVTEGRDVVACVPRRAVDAHKWSVGGLFVVGGSGGMTGAPLMVSHAAMRTGAGIVWCGVPGQHAAAAGSGTEVITKALPAADDGALDEPAADAVLDGLDRFGACVVGPGLGTAPATASAVRRLVRGAPVPLLLDADGLNALAGDLEPLRARTAATVLTPHEGEYQRLTGHAVGADRVAAARELAEQSGAVVLLKGPTTVTAGPDGRVALNLTGGSWLATAGTGDVLSGIVGGLLAQGVEPFAAAATGAWLHGRAADVAGHTGLVAGDLIAALPRTLAELDRAGDRTEP
jgi:NAD(P)H-hydrate epimerase